MDSVGCLHSIENEGTRLDVVNRLVRHVMVEKGCEAKFGEAIGAMKWCKGIRNQYAHAQWVKKDGQMMFGKATDMTWQPDASYTWKVINLPLLKLQESYFEYTRKCLMWFELAFSEPSEILDFPEHTAKPAKSVL